MADLLGVLWVLAAAGAVMAPALAHGSSLGPFDLLTQVGLTKQSGVVVHNQQTGDLIRLFIPWSALAWTQVHHGQLPLWDPYSALGMPLAFNWESAPFSLPALLGYLVPLRYAYTVGVLVTLVVAGTGVYVLARVLRLGVLGSALAGTVFELSGQFMANLGWPLSSVMSWAGWLFAAAILVVRGRRRSRDVVLFAVVLAFAVYAGYPEAVIILELALLVFLVVFLALRAPRLGGSGPVLRPVGDLVIATVAGLALAMPLALPGLQIASQSVRNATLPVTGVGGQTLIAHDVLHLILPGFDGLPWQGSTYFGPIFTNYMESAAYVGVITLVLAVAGVVVRRRRHEALAFGAVAVVTAVLVFVPPLVSVIGRLPSAGRVRWYESLGPMTLALAVLAGMGMDALVRTYGKRSVRIGTGVGFAVAGLALATLWATGRGQLPANDETVRAQSFIWPVVDTVVGLAVVGTLALLHRRTRLPRGSERRSRPGVGRWAGGALLACETVFLVAAGAPLFSSSPTFLTPTPATLALQRAVGSSVVGFGPCSPDLGVYYDVNVAFGIQELPVYDPVIPQRYFSSWEGLTGQQPKTPLDHSSVFCPSVTTSSAARRFGVAYVLEPHGAPGPQGAVFDTRVGDEDLYRVPGAAVATLSPLSSTDRFPGDDAPGRPVPVTHRDPASWKMVTSSATPGVLRLRLTDLPGWHASIDKRPLDLRRFSGVMLQARIPAGRHTIVLTYWPRTFTTGIVLAACSAAGLAVALFVGRRGRRRPPTSIATAASGPTGS